MLIFLEKKIEDQDQDLEIGVKKLAPDQENGKDPTPGREERIDIVLDPETGTGDEIGRTTRGTIAAI